MSNTPSASNPWLTVVQEGQNIRVRDFQGREETFHVWETFQKLHLFNRGIPRSPAARGSVQQMAHARNSEDPTIRILYFDTEPRSDIEHPHWYIQHRDCCCFYAGCSQKRRDKGEASDEYKNAIEDELATLAELITSRILTDFSKINPEEIADAWV
jgi:hypothetical protein